MSDTRSKTVELSAEELGLIKANLAFAIENCPVEGGIVTEDGTFSSRDSYEALLRKLEPVPVNPTNNVQMSDKELQLLIASAEYSLTYCPVEGIMTEDGRFASRELVTTLLEKLKGIRRKD
jgi:hypothetical protein